MDLQQLKEGVMELSKRNGRYFEKEQDNGQVHELIESLCQIETRIKIQDGRLNSDTIIEEIKKGQSRAYGRNASRRKDVCSCCGKSIAKKYQYCGPTKFHLYMSW